MISELVKVPLRYLPPGAASERDEKVAITPLLLNVQSGEVREDLCVELQVISF